MFFDKVLEKMTPPKDSNPLCVHIVLDKYIKNSTKTGARKARGESSSNRLFITGLGQSMPSTMDEWRLALSNNETKQSLFLLLTNYVCSGKAHLPYITMINDVDQTWMIDSKDQNISKLFICNHEEADTRMIYHASLQGANSVVISANDSDVFFLGTYACALDKNRKWYFNYQSCSFADLRRIADLLGDSALQLPAFHSLTGCDTTSYFYFRGKTAPWERAIKTPNSLDLIKNLGCELKLPDEDIDNSVEFIRRFIYNGKKGEDLVDTRIRMYKEQVKKKTSALPPDPNSIRYDWKIRFVWKRCLNDIIEPLPWLKMVGKYVMILFFRSGKNAHSCHHT